MCRLVIARVAPLGTSQMQPGSVNASNNVTQIAQLFWVPANIPPECVPHARMQHTSLMRRDDANTICRAAHTAPAVTTSQASAHNARATTFWIQGSAILKLAAGQTAILLTAICFPGNAASAWRDISWALVLASLYKIARKTACQLLVRVTWRVDFVQTAVVVTLPTLLVDANIQSCAVPIVLWAAVTIFLVCACSALMAISATPQADAIQSNVAAIFVPLLLALVT